MGVFTLGSARGLRAVPSDRWEEQKETGIQPCQSRSRASGEQAGDSGGRDIAPPLLRHIAMGIEYLLVGATLADQLKAQLPEDVGYLRWLESRR